MILRRVQWSSEAAQVLMPAAANNIAKVKKEVEQCRVRLYEVRRNNKKVAYVTLGTTEDGLLYIDCYAGSSLIFFVSCIKEYAMKAGFLGLRAYTENVQLLRVMQKKIGVEYINKECGFMFQICFEF